MLNPTGTGKRVLVVAGIVILVAILATQTYMIVGDRRAQAVNNSSLNGTNYNTVTVSGAGQVGVQPDRAIVSIGVLTQDPTAEGAVQQNANKMSSVISAIERTGVSNSSIQTSYYSINPQQSCCSGAPTITGYQVTNQVQVTIVAAGNGLAQLGAKVGQVIDAAAASGANQVYGIQFTASKNTLQQARQTALQQAVQNASKDARLLASAAGVSITGVLSVTTSPSYSPPAYYTTALAVAGAASTPVIAPQSLTVTAIVQMVYSIG